MTVSLLKTFNAEVAEAEEHYCGEEVRRATYIDPPEYCEEEATVQLDSGEWVCAGHARMHDAYADEDEGRDMEYDYWLDDMGD